MSKSQASSVNPVVALVAEWAVPGLGHVLLKKYYRALFLFLAITLLFFTGIALGGRIYLLSTDDMLDKLGFVADIGNPLLYVLTLVNGWAQQPVLTAVATYGKVFIAASGLLNVIAAIDAHSLASGRKAGQ